ncbi:YoaK family protein, partial [Streptomyces sp. WAC06614]|uniref:YoaK family protein n=1 Tax=Streptomyces sp. WAC06614 TaxID=2487416 RepID=UPI000FB15194
GRAGSLPTLAPAISLGAFAVGAVAGARLEARAQARGRRWFVLGLFVEAGVLACAAVVGWGLAPHYGSPTHRHLAVIAVLAFVMGIRNVTAMRVGLPGVPTTLSTRSLTGYLGAVLGRDASFDRGGATWQRRAAAVVAMFLGGAAGALLVRAGWPVNLLLAPAVLLVLALALFERTQPPLGPPGTGRPAGVIRRLCARCARCVPGRTPR